jgi:hypothetical protein
VQKTPILSYESFRLPKSLIRCMKISPCLAHTVPSPLQCTLDVGRIHRLPIQFLIHVPREQMTYPRLRRGKNDSGVKDEVLSYRVRMSSLIASRPMSMEPRAAFEEWRKADQEARAMEVKLADAWRQYDSRSGEPPSAELMQEVSLLRAKAMYKLNAAMSSISASRELTEHATPK